jgi:hypothetical protein
VPGAPNLPPGFLAAMGDAAQVPTQWSGDEAAVAVFGVKQRASRGSRRRQDLPDTMVMIVLISIGPTLHLTAVSWRRGRSRIVAGAAGVEGIPQRNGRLI